MICHGKGKIPLCCPEKSIHVKQSIIGSSEKLSAFTHFSKSKTALSLASA